MSLRLKFNLILGLVTLLGIVVSGFFANHFLQQNAREEVLNSARVMLKSAEAVRHYTVSEVRPLLRQLQSQRFLPQTVPAYSARAYIAALQQTYPAYSYKEATLNPTNLADRASGWEVDVIEWYRNNDGAEELIGERDAATGPVLYLSQPIRITNEACLSCHSTPAKAPPAMVETYGSGNGFGWQLNEVVGAQIVTVPMSVPFARADAAFRVMMTSLVAVFLTVGVVLNILLNVIVLRPVREIADNADRVSTGDLNSPELRIHSDDEIGSLAQSFNRMHRSLLNAVKLLDER